MYQNLETEMKVEGVAIGFDGTVNLASFYIADHHSDTLFMQKTLKLIFIVSVNGSMGIYFFHPPNLKI